MGFGEDSSDRDNRTTYMVTESFNVVLKGYLKPGMTAVTTSMELGERLLEGLKSVKGIRLYGPSTMDNRLPGFLPERDFEAKRGVFLHGRAGGLHGSIHKGDS